VLVPRRELDAAAGNDDPERRLVAAARADVSDVAAMRAVADSLAPGFALVLCRGNRVEASTVSPETYTETPYPGGVFERGHYLRDVDASGATSLGQRTVIWWYLAPPDRAHRVATAQSREILAAILSDVEDNHGAEYAAGARLSVNGIIGSANSIAKHVTSEEDFVALLRQRFAARPSLGPVIENDLFPAFLWARAEELAERRRT
jgi:hypothetical protein